MGTAVFHVDAFTDRPFAGNPAAVCRLEAPAPAGWRQAVARDLNLPATAFVVPEDGGWALTWYSPTAELALCGHGTLATAHVLWESGALPADAAARFRTAGGPLTATRRDGGVEIDLPAVPVTPTAVPAGLLEALGTGARAVGRNGLDYLVEVDSATAVRDLTPDLRRLRQVETRGVIVTAPAADGADFVSRFFAPRAGIDEDFVTGSAHCALGPFWAARLGRTELVGHQLSRRGGLVRVRVLGDRVALVGRSVTVYRGELA